MLYQLRTNILTSPALFLATSIAIARLQCPNFTELLARWTVLIPRRYLKFDRSDRSGTILLLVEVERVLLACKRKEFRV